MVLHLRLIAPPDCIDRARAIMRENPGVTNVVVLPGAGESPAGDVVMADVAREATSDVQQRLARRRRRPRRARETPRVRG